MDIYTQREINDITEAPCYDLEAHLPTTWTTRDGRTLNIVDMADSHLLNTIAYLQRNADGLYWREMERDVDLMEGMDDEAIGHVQQDFLEMDPNEYLKKYNLRYVALVKECEGRKLPTPDDFVPQLELSDM